MGITRISHLYVECTDWAESCGFWEGLGFTFTERWGDEGHRAGRLARGDAIVVLAEVGTDPALNVFFDLAGADVFVPGDGVDVTVPLEDTHWGSRWIRVTDPDGRTYALEEAP